MFFRNFKRTFWIFYDNLLKGIIINFIFFIILFLIFFIGIKTKRYLEGAGAIILLWYLLVPAIMYYFSKIIRVEETSGITSEIFSGIKLYSLKSIVVLVLNLAFVSIAFLAINFYKNLGGQFKVLGIILGGIGIWILLVFLIMQIYILPILVLDEKRRVLTSFKKALIMVMTNPFSAFFTFLTIIYLLILFYPIFIGIFGSKISFFLSFLTLFPIFLLPFISFVLIILLQLNATFLIYEKHNIFKNLNEIWEDRKLSNILKPWETR